MILKMYFNTSLSNVPAGSRGEADRFVGEIVFGGLIYPLRNPDEDDDLVCSVLPALMKF